MAYSIVITKDNGYRCSCCRHEYTRSPIWVDTLEEALKHIPHTGLPERDDFDGGGPCSVDVFDGTGEKVAWGWHQFSTGFGRYSAYRYQKWAGFRPDCGSFTLVFEGTTPTSKTWEQVTAELAEEKRLADLKKAEQDLLNAQARIASLSKPT